MVVMVQYWQWGRRLNPALCKPLGISHDKLQIVSVYEVLCIDPPSPPLEPKFMNSRQKSAVPVYFEIQ